MRTYVLFLLALVLLKANPVFAAEACVNDPQGTRGIGKNQSINNALHTASDPLTKAFLASMGRTDCPPGSVATKTAADIKKVVNSTLSIHSNIKAECIQASLQREVGNTGYTCNKDQPTPFENFKSSAPCINQKTSNFIQFSVNQAIKCMSPADDPIDPRVILRKINNETGFNFYIGYTGGVGIGQLTSDPVNEIAGWTDTVKIRDPKTKKIRVKTTYNQGNAHSILETLAANTNPACAPFKKIIEKELTGPPPSPGSKRNYCSWLSVGEGLGRSLVYGLGYYVYARDHFIKESLADRAPDLIKNKDLVNTLTLVAYGPGGPAQAKSLIRTLRLNNRSKPQEVIDKISKQSDYVSQTNDKMNELMANMNKPSPTEADLRGDTCVSQ